MTRKLVFVFLVLMLCFYTLISSFLGERGIIVNNRIKRQLKNNEYELDRKDVEIETLKLQEKELETEDGQRSVAMNLGYKVDDDEVYVFSTEGETVLEIGQEKTSEGESVEQSGDFVPWKTWFILLISFIASSIITVLIGILRKGKRKEDDSEQEESGDSGDYSGYNQ